MRRPLLRCAAAGGAAAAAYLVVRLLVWPLWDRPPARQDVAIALLLAALTALAWATREPWPGRARGRQ